MKNFVFLKKDGKKRGKLRGDSLIEVMIGVAIFGMVSVGAIQIMNRGLYAAQESLEVTMARNEMDTQAEVLRFIHDSYAADLSDSENIYAKVWQKITENSISANEAANSHFFTDYENSNIGSCGDLYETDGSTKSAIIPGNSFMINPRYLGEESLLNGVTNQELDKVISTFSLTPSADSFSFSSSGTYPRLLYGLDETLKEQSYESELSKAEGIWITAVRSEKGVECTKDEERTDFIPEFYDFYIRTCWDAPDGKRASTISSTVRLYNPLEVETTPEEEWKEEEVTLSDLTWERYDDHCAELQTKTSMTGAEQAYFNACVPNGISNISVGEGISNVSLLATNKMALPPLKEKSFSNNGSTVDEHAVIDGNNVTLYGYFMVEMDGGVKHSFARDSVFSLNFSIDGSTLLPHPAGYGIIAVGDFQVLIQKDAVYLDFSPVSILSKVSMIDEMETQTCGSVDDCINKMNGVKTQINQLPCGTQASCNTLENSRQNAAIILFNRAQDEGSCPASATWQSSLTTLYVNTYCTLGSSTVTNLLQQLSDYEMYSDAASKIRVLENQYITYENMLRAFQSDTMIVVTDKSLNISVEYNNGMYKINVLNAGGATIFGGEYTSSSAYPVDLKFGMYHASHACNKLQELNLRDIRLNVAATSTHSTIPSSASTCEIKSKN